MTLTLPKPGSIGDLVLISLEESEPGEWLQLRDIAVNIGASVQHIRVALQPLIDAEIIAHMRSPTGHSSYSICDAQALADLRSKQIAEARAKAKAFREKSAAKRK